MAICCDAREREVIEELKRKNTQIEVKQLIVGDFIIESKNKTVVVERKTMNDLSASIIDGRYKEQKQRLQRMKEQGCEVVYILEGEKEGQSRISGDTMMSVMLSLSMKYDFHVIQSKNVKETVIFLKKIQDKIETYVRGNTLDEMVIPKKNYNIGVQMNILCCVKGISKTIAQKIITEHKSIHELCEYLKENGEGSLCNIPKVGPKLSMAVYTSLCKAI